MAKGSVVITGANGGFGRLSARALAGAGYTVFAAMRSTDGKNAGAAAEARSWAARERLDVRVVDMDVTQDASVEQAAREVLAHGAPAAVVNNAGHSIIGLSEASSAGDLRALFEVNVLGAQRVNRAFLPSMREAKRGVLVHVSSTLGRVVMPGTGAYSATKFALEALAEAYRYELAPLGVDVVIVEPGAFPTDFASKALVADDPARAAGYGPLAGLHQQIVGAVQQMNASPAAPSPRLVADEIVRIVEAPPGRPLRVVIDPTAGRGAEAINAACDEVASQVLGAMGMGGLLPPRA